MKKLVNCVILSAWYRQACRDKKNVENFEKKKTQLRDHTVQKISLKLTHHTVFFFFFFLGGGTFYRIIVVQCIVSNFGIGSAKKIGHDIWINKEKKEKGSNWIFLLLAIKCCFSFFLYSFTHSIYLFLSLERFLSKRCFMDTDTFFWQVHRIFYRGILFCARPSLLTTTCCPWYLY